MASPADQIASIIPTTVLGGTTGWTTKLGKITQDPNQLAVFYDVGGASPNPKFRLDYRSMMVIVRGNPNDYAGAYQKAQDLKDVLLGIDPQDMASGDRLDGITMMGDIAFMSYDDKERPQFSLNFRVFWEPAANTLNTARSSL